MLSTAEGRLLAAFFTRQALSLIPVASTSVTLFFISVSAVEMVVLMVVQLVVVLEMMAVCVLAMVFLITVMAVVTAVRIAVTLTF